MWNWLLKSDNSLPSNTMSVLCFCPPSNNYKRSITKNSNTFADRCAKKAFIREITRTRRYHEEKSFWEYVNNLVEDIHVYTWRKMVVVSCTDTYKRRRYLLEQELRDQQALHRKERITLRYDSPSEV